MSSSIIEVNADFSVGRGDLASLVTVHIPELCRTFEQATGWPLRYVPSTVPVESGEPLLEDISCAWWHAVSVCDSVVGYLRMDLPGPSDEVADLHVAGELGDQIGLLVGQLLDRTQRLNEREGELATVVDLEAVSSQPASLQPTLVEALKSVVESVGARSAALFLLDPSVTWLTLRAVYNLRPEETPPSPRDLRLAPYDLEALGGNAVVVEDAPRVAAARQGRPFVHDESDTSATLSDQPLSSSAWCPTGHLSGVCVAVGSESMPLGTLWVYGDQLRTFTGHELRLIQATSNRIAATLDHVVLARDSSVKRRLSRELSVASHFQTYLLPESVPEHPRYELAAWTRPRRELGGDLYDLIPMSDERLGIAIGDASGKSIPAAIVMASARGGLRAYVETSQEVDETIARLNGNLWSSTRGEHFMTFFFAVLDPNRRRFEYTGAGHPATLLFRGRAVRELRSSGLVLGVQPDAVYEKTAVDLQPDDVLVFYTDGISESSDAERRLFGSDGITAAVRPWLAAPAEEILKRLLAATEQFGREGPYQDDMTLLVLKIR